MNAGRLRLAPAGRGGGYDAVARVAAMMPEIALVDPDDAPDEVLFADPAVDAVWIGAPVRSHAARTIAALSAGKHVIVEKPMALLPGDTDAMIAVAQRMGVQLLAGHTSYSYQLPIRAMRRLALSGRLGRPKAILIWSATEWMLRPRPAEEAGAAGGAGLIHRQAPHQIETLRLLAPGRLTSVRAAVGEWMPGTNEPCYYTALFTFDDGLSATIVHNGAGYFMTLELFPDAAAHHPYTDAARPALRREMRGGSLSLAGAPKIGATSLDQPWSPIDLGLTILSCERGELCHAPHGVRVYDDAGRQDIDLRPLMRERLRGETDLGGGAIVQALNELAAAVGGVAPLAHDGAWGRATLEATLGLIASARERREVALTRQTSLPATFDAGLDIG